MNDPAAGSQACPARNPGRLSAQSLGPPRLRRPVEAEDGLEHAQALIGALSRIPRTPCTIHRCLDDPQIEVRAPAV